MHPLRHTVNHLPHQPGVYLFADRSGAILYVGKARDLRKRVSSYLQKTNALTAPKREMIRLAVALSSIVTPSEAEALLLEATLIKRHQPPYNIILKDDRDYLYVHIDLREAYPPVNFVRRPRPHRGVRLFGPYTSAFAIRQTLRLLKRIFPYRTCAQPPDDPCFDSRLGRCAGHDLAPGSKQRYQELIRGVITFLEGRTDEVISLARTLMERAAVQQHFELAAKLRDQLRALEQVSFRQIVIGRPKDHRDAIGFAREGNAVGVAVVRVRQGRIIDSRTFRLSARKDEALGAIVTAFLDQYYASTEDRPKEIILRIPPLEQPAVIRHDRLKLCIATRGLGHRLVEMANENARVFLERKQREALTSQEKGRRGLEDLTKRLGLAARPERIEAYDISNIQGTNAVGSLVVFERGLPAKQWYRKFTIKTVQGSDDFRMMAEVLTRRLRNREWPLPDLFVLDGGKGQLSAVTPIFRTRRIRTPLIALAKREEEIFRPRQSKPIKLPPDSEGLLLLERMRDEAHRFAIGFYRGKHRKEAVRSLLDEIPGIGPRTKKLLLTTFGSVEGIRGASDAELAKLIGERQLTSLREHL